MLSILQLFSPLDWVLMGIALLCLIPAFLFLKYFQYTGVGDYSLYSGMWITGMITHFAKVIHNRIYPDIIAQQIADAFSILFFFLVFLYAMRMKWEHPPRVLWYSGIIWFSFMQLIILLYEVVFIPERGIFFIFEVIRFGDWEIGVGFISQGGIIIMSSGFRLLSHIWRLFVMLLFIYVNLTTPFIIKMDHRVKVARNLWVSAGLIACIPPILVLGHHFSLWTVSEVIYNTFYLLGLINIAYVSIRYPESLLLSYVQIARAHNLYKTIQTNNMQKEFGISVLIEYLQKLPKDIILMNDN
ncbi:MAG: hypothetical protein ACXADY_25710 [Candidatus Hodarchaeales archaeon]